MSDELHIGFTASPVEPPTGARRIAKDVADAVKRETTAVAMGAEQHPHTATGIVLALGALAFVIGYAMGRAR
ncbi:hypothetical protein HGP17_09230 [Rhizobium sp. P38BS-XIX]|uniref:hypothetical protein n=1 Tax=Rhizobium sp. P38BS-XIX TaxID=2726740 RepID=UPI0014578469|nr:hypothetical protein [Rhizobium sp. P38BS-XIX]NLR97017.1 hypothetical protein [Rhizobium sp. P38BS-XIX]